MAKKDKKKRSKAPRKPQPLPKSVTALLKYLGGSDVRVGATSRAQPAQLAPTAINIAVTQQQQQQQQFVKQRVAPVTGQVIGKSPLSAIIPQQPVVVQQPPISTAETDRKIQEQARQAEFKQNELNRKFGMLEADQSQFRQTAALAYQEIKQDLSRRITGDVNIFDARNIAQRFAPKPVVEEQQFAGMSFGQVAERGAQGITVTEVFRGAKEEEASSGLGEYLGSRYISDVSSPEMTPVQRSRGRPKKISEAAKKAGAMLKAKTLTTAEVSSSSALLEKTPITIASLGQKQEVPGQGKKILLKLKKQPVSMESAPDMATQIALLTGGGSAAAPQSQGKSIAEIMGAKK